MKQSTEHFGADVKTRSVPSWARIVLCMVVLIGTGIFTYRNSFQGSFVFDDRGAIEESPYIWSLWDPGTEMWAAPQSTLAGRPVAAFTVAVNYALGGMDVWGYHALNLGVHILGALVLFGILRRTLLLERMRDRFGGAATLLALVVALIWVVHPLQTESVTYIIQRVESVMGLFYLLTLYCAIRGFTSARHAGFWYSAAVLSCGLGMGSKEVMFSAPLVVLLYDWAFVTRSFEQAVRRRWKLYAGLAATWVILATLVATGPRTESVGFGLKSVTPWDYAKAQPRAIVAYYLRPTFWPDRLVFDYGWPMAKEFPDYAPFGVVVLGLLGLTVWGLWRRPVLGFLGACFFLILGPTSSVLPIATEIVAEHRMYLPLASIVALLMVGGYALGQRLVSRPGFSGRGAATVGMVAGVALVAVVVATLSHLTFERNKLYYDRITLWRDTLKKRPDNHRAHYNLGWAFFRKGHYDDAVMHYWDCLRINPETAHAHNALAKILIHRGRLDEAIQHCQEAVRIYPEFPEAHSNLGAALLFKGTPAQAEWHLRRSLDLKPYLAEAHRNLASLLATQYRFDEAGIHFRKAIELQPNSPEAHNDYGQALLGEGRIDQARREYERALAISPDYPEAHHNLGRLLMGQGQIGEAISHYEVALRGDPYHLRARMLLAEALALQRRTDEAMEHARTLLELSPQAPEAHTLYAGMLLDKGELDGVIEHCHKALELNSNLPDARFYLSVALGRKGKLDEALQHSLEVLKLQRTPTVLHHVASLLAEKGKLDEAIKHWEEALRMRPDFAQAHLGLGMALHQKGELNKAIEHYEKVVQLTPDVAQGHSQLAVALYSKGRRAEAKKHCRATLRIDPNHVPALNALAWILATAPEEQLRNGAEAVVLARRACELTGNKVPGLLDTLAVAYAEAGRFDEAVTTAERALQLASETKQAQLVKELNDRLKLYKARRPFHETPK